MEVKGRQGTRWLALVVMLATIAISLCAFAPQAWAVELNYDYDSDGDTASDSWDISAEDSSGTVYAYLTENESESGTYTLTVAGSGSMENYGLRNADSEIGNTPWHEALRSVKDTLFPITEIVMDGEVSYVCNGAFAQLAITEISFDTDITEYGTYVFYGCTSATTVDWTNFNSSIVAIPEGLLYGCTSLNTFKLNDTVSSGGALILPSNVTKIGISSFGSCIGITSANLANTEQIDNNAFGACSNLTSITLPETVYDGDTYFVKACFVGTGIQEITLPSNLTTIPESLFRNCKSLTSIAIPDSVTTIGTQAFNSCTSLSSVTFGENSQLKTIGKWAFSKTALTTFDMPDSVTELTDQYTFSNNESLTEITISNSLTSIPDRTFTLEDDMTSVLEKVVIDLDNSKLTSIGYNALYGSAIESIAFPASMTNIGATALYNCNNLSSIDLTRVDASKITFGNAWCYYNHQNGVLRAIYISSTDMKDVLDAASYGYSYEKTFFAVTNGGIFEEGAVFEDGQLDTPTKEGYIFDGWYTQDGTTSGDWGDEVTTVTTYGGVYYAKWTAAAASVTSGETTTMYATLAEALNAAATDSTVMLLSDVSDGISVASDKDITIDLNGHMVTNSDAAALTNAGTVTVIDGSSEGTGAVTVSGDYAAVSTTGALSIKSGAFTGSLTVLGDGTIAVSGGTFSEQVVAKYLATGYASTAKDESTNLYSVVEGKVTAWGAGLRVDKYVTEDSYDISAADLRFGFGWSVPTDAKVTEIGWTATGLVSGTKSGEPYNVDSGTNPDTTKYISYRTADNTTYSYDKETGCNVSNLVLTNISSDKFATTATVQMYVKYTAADGSVVTIVSDPIERSVYNVAAGVYTSTGTGSTSYLYVKALLKDNGQLNESNELITEYN